MTKAHPSLKKVWDGKIVSQIQNPPPKTFTLRLTAKQRQQLEAKAKGQPLGTYVRGQLFDNNGAIKPLKARSVGDPQAIARILAELGRSNLSKNMSDLRDLANAGALPVSEETCLALTQACKDISDIRLMLIRALGLRRGK